MLLSFMHLNYTMRNIYLNEVFLYVYVSVKASVCMLIVLCYGDTVFFCSHFEVLF